MQKIVIILFLSAYILQAGFFSSPEKVTVVSKMPPMDVEYEKGEALFILNEIRETMGMNTLMPNTQLQIAAQAHADYLVRNHTASHSEIQGLLGFTGETPTDRAFRAGYLSSWVQENLSTQTRDARHSVHGLLSAIYHRFAFLDVGIDEIGVGLSQDTKDPENNAFVYVMGSSYLNDLCHEKSFKGYGRYLYHVCRDESFRIAQNHFDEAKNANKINNPKVVVYPYDGQQEVPPAFYSEIPDPLPDYEVSGFPVSVTFNDYFFDKVELLEFKLYKDGDKAVNSVRLLNHDTDPNDRFSQFEFALFPLERLAYDTDYKAEIVYREKGKKNYLSWQFHTRVPGERMLRITTKEVTITIKKDESYLLYIVPLNAHDVIKGVVFPDDVYVRFVDNNTLRLKLMSQRSKSFDIKSKYHTIHVNVE
jgi:uncharacterized protein YkwD